VEPESSHLIKEGGDTARIRTLIIEDSPQVRCALINLLETHPAVEIVGTAADGERGLELAAKLRPDLVIGDMELSRHNGLAIAETLRERLPALRLVLVSVHDGLMWHNLGRVNGADAFLSKHRIHLELPALIEKLFPGCARPRAVRASEASPSTMQTPQRSKSP
jgi:two-component system nitrate/nitrite response regulator NarL